MTRILVLGGHGFVGAHVARNLRKFKQRVFPVSRRDGVDATKYSVFRRALEKIRPHSIINCAAHVGGIAHVSKYCADVLRNNSAIAMNLYRAVKEVNPAIKIVQPLSNCSYPGDANRHSEPEWWDGPVHDSIFGYGVSRKIYWALAHTYYQQYGIRTVNWLTPNGYGPGDHTDPSLTHALNGIIMRLIQAQKRGDAEFVIWGSGKPTREWGYVEDVARILAHSALHVNEQVYPVNFAQNQAYSITRIARIAAKALGYKVKFAFDTSKPDGAPFKILDDRAFRKSYPKFTFTSLEDGIRNTIHYYQKVL